MRKSELEKCIENLETVKQVADKLDYNTSLLINKKLIEVLPLLKKDLSKMDTTDVEINSPKFELITQKKAEEAGKSVVDYLNTYMEQLVIAEYTIIDYGYINTEAPYAFVKYTN